MGDDLKSKILDDIQKTGFVTELLVGRTLIKQNWKVQHSTSYLDKDSGKSRELDILASKAWINKDHSIRLSFRIALQVKSSKRPWVIFTTLRNSNDIGWGVAHTLSNLIPYEHLPFPEISAGVMRADHKRVGTAFHEAFKSPNEPSQIYDAVLSCCKAISATKVLYDLSLDKPEEYDPDKWHELNILIPTVVLDGQLFEAYLNETGDTEIGERDFIPVDFSYSSTNAVDLNSPQAEDMPAGQYFPDIVVLSWLDNYLTSVENWATTIVANLVKRFDRERSIR